MKTLLWIKPRVIPFGIEFLFILTMTLTDAGSVRITASRHRMLNN